MSMSSQFRKTMMAVAACGALAVGGAAIADAATSGNSTTGSSTAQSTTAAPSQAPGNPGGPGRHTGANGKQESALAADTAKKVEAAALANVAGATVERVETDVDHGSPYEAHVRKSDGTQAEVLVNKDFKVTAVNDMQHP
jgi:uncharacterized membrane protein YkoI